MHTHVSIHCRICKSIELEDVIDMGEQYNTSKFPEYKDYTGLEKSRIVLMVCKQCELLQMRYTHDQDSLYKHEYGYESSISNTMRVHLNKYNMEIQGTVSRLVEGDIVMDIGSNDGTLLSYYPSTIRRIGVDPTGRLFEDRYGGMELVKDYFTYSNVIEAVGEVKCKVISSIAMFYDLPDPVQFARDIYTLLEDDGIWTCEQSYILSILERKAFDTICHEHLEYYGVKQIKTIADMVGFKIINILYNDSNGGSFRVYFAKKESQQYGECTGLIEQALRREVQWKLGTAEPYSKFMEHCQEQVDKLQKFLWLAKWNNKSVYVYGASTKGNCVLQYAGITEALCAYAVERNPKKVGKMTSTGIRIISEQDMRSNPPDFLLVLPWHFRKEVLEREAVYLEGGGQMIFPLPDFEVTGMKEKLLITGCDGMIARHMKEENDNRYYLYGVGHMVEDRVNEHGIVKAYFDMQDTKKLERYIDMVRPDGIIHLAAISSSRYALDNPVETIQMNGMVTVQLCDILHRNGWGHIRLCNVTSSDMYKGHIKREVKEDDTYYKHLHPYSIAKMVGQNVVDFYRETYGYTYSNCVLFTVESRYKRGDFLLSKVAKHIREFGHKREPLKVGSLESYRNILHGSDAARAIYKGIEQDTGDNYLVCNMSDSICKVKDIVTHMYRRAGYDVKDMSGGKVDRLVLEDTGEDVLIIEKEYKGFDSTATCINGQPVKLLQLGWTPKMTIEDIVDEFFECQ